MNNVLTIELVLATIMGFLGVLALAYLWMLRQEKCRGRKFRNRWEHYTVVVLESIVFLFILGSIYFLMVRWVSCGAGLE